MSETKQALAPEEWAAAIKEGVGGPEVTVGQLRAAALQGDGAVRGRYLSGVPSRHVLAALCLHGQDFGFTWEDVDAIDRELEDEWSGVDDSAFAHVAHLRSLRDRIAALLPPREEEG